MQWLKILTMKVIGGLHLIGLTIATHVNGVTNAVLTL
jgi:hypothetical protein